ncbi:DNA helicase [Trueperella bernardiae]|uniref:RNA helicase n=1 Tax=Trueperella bernardiae TaxID=59561 RepID=A0AAW6ZGE7_9ACTO|nr:DEAD/DEAH box helicase [Trueperella bernardiae]MDK8602335.1 DEAD/DEAH box helicase [Trueperella bernardiae]PKZ90076.1 DNA helicase [Trueperella bernardiae]WIM08461.1 DEAD/DEAH box helicase [Trueperella bernardiae]
MSKVNTVHSGIVNTSGASVRPANEPKADIQASGSELELETKSFADFGVSDDIVEALAEKGITHPFPIQALTLPVALKGSDIIGQAKTGTGKTLGFGIPMVEKVIGPGEEGWEKLRAPGKPQGLVVVPTRELAKQVAGDLRDIAAKRSVRVVEVYGGKAYEPQVKELARGAEIVVGTPGRIIDLGKHRTLDLSHAHTVVLDEADEMLDLGFLEDVEAILSSTPPNRHTMLFSATMPGPVITMARRYMSKPTHIRAQNPDDDSATVKQVKQVVYRCHALNKSEVLARILQARGRGLTIIFTRTKRAAARLADELESRGFATGALHGDLGQGAREQAMRAFRNGKIDVLVATDVAARGIDVDDVTHVINYQCPEDEKTYLHRIGRTGRAGQAGTAVTFVDWEDTPRWSVINKILNLGYPEPVETYHTSDHLYTDLDIDPEVTGRLPRSQRTRAGLDAEEIEDLGETGRGPRGRGRGGRGNKGRGGRGRGEAGRSGRKRTRTRVSSGASESSEQPRTDKPRTDKPRRRRVRKAPEA